jgi:2-polyprenyl-3-methyl-5-hydroxy-6-metoxy-1,4-benzoquinol methylase
MFIDTTYRSNAPEIMDNFALEGAILKDALDKIAKINQLLGGNKLSLLGLRDLIVSIPKSKHITIVDVGCGNGDMLRALANFGINNHFNFQLIGIDANAFTVNYATKLSVDYPNIRFRCEDVLSQDFENLQYDIVLCTLTLHHFKDSEIIQLMSVFNANSRVGIVINDLHRSAVAYRLFQVLCFIFRLNAMSREDGLVSILRGFKKEELIRFSENLELKKYKIKWKWAFRYQWIIKKTLR